MDTTRFETVLRGEKERLENEQKENIKEADFNNVRHFFPEEEADQVEAHDIELSLNQNIENRIAEIDAALDRIHQGTYGICETCGKAIDESRLNANPAARTHTACA